jgi:hypothetical protein
MYKKPCVIKTIKVEYKSDEKSHLSNAWIKFTDSGGRKWLNSTTWNKFN